MYIRLYRQGIVRKCLYICTYPVKMRKKAVLIVRVEPELKKLMEKRLGKGDISEYIRALVKKDLGFRETPIVY